MHYSVDRIEGEYVLLLPNGDAQCMVVQRDALPADICEGDILWAENGAWYADPQETQKQRDRTTGLLDSLLGGRENK